VWLVRSAAAARVVSVGWTWSARAAVSAEPAAAAPFGFGASVVSWRPSPGSASHLKVEPDGLQT